MFHSVEQQTYAAIVSKHMAVADAPLLLEGGTGIGKTRAYLSALVCSGRRVAIVPRRINSSTSCWARETFG